MDVLRYFLSEKKFQEESSIFNKLFRYRDAKNNNIIHIAANYDSYKHLDYLLQIYNDKYLIRQLNKDASSPLDIIIQKQKQDEQYSYSNSLIKKIIEPYLTHNSMIYHTEPAFDLNNQSFEAVCKRGDSDLLSILFRNSKFEHNSYEKFDFNSYLRISMENDNEKIAEGIMEQLKAFKYQFSDQCHEKIANNRIKCNHFLIEHEVFRDLVEKKKWWSIVESVLDYYDFLSKEELDKNNEIQNEIKWNREKLNSKFCFYSFDYLFDAERKFRVVETDRSSLILPKLANETEEIINANKHALVLIAKSGQKNLTMHRTVLQHLELKWRYFPRLFYYINTLLHLVFLVLFSIYTLNNSTKIHAIYKKFSNNSLVIKSEIYHQFSESAVHFGISLALSFYFLIYELVQMILLKVFPYFTSVKNLIELVTYALSTVSLMLFIFGIYLDLMFIASILFGVVDLVLRLERMHFIGIYIIALRRSFKSTLKILPIILSLYKLKTDLGQMKTEEPHDESNLHAITKIIKMLSENNLILSILLINLLIGIAFIEIRRVLENAEIYHIQNKIQYVLNIQRLWVKFFELSSCMERFKHVLLFKYFDATETWVAKLLRYLGNIWRSIKEYFKTGIEFVDEKEKKVEELFGELKKSNKYESNSLKEYISTHIKENDGRIHELDKSFNKSISEFSHRVVEMDESLNLRGLSGKLDELNAKLEASEKRFSDLNELVNKKLDKIIMKKLH